MDNNLKTIVINLFSLLVVLGFITGLVACHDEDDIDFNAPSITIVSPSPGSDVTSLSVLVTGTVSSDVVLVELTYGDVTDTATLTGTTFSGTVTLVPGANSISAKARDAVGNRNTVTFNLQYPQLTLTDGQAAAFVLGQADFVSNQPNQGTTAAANTLSGVQASLYEKGYTTLYIPDSANNRILGFDAIPSVSNTSANFVLGQPDFASVAAGLSATQFDLPSGVYTTMTQFFLADTNNNRVLIWDSHPTNNSVAAAHVIGQLDFISSTPNCSSSTLMGPTSVFVVNDKVVVLDKGNHRVLIWNAIPDADGVAADVVLGQVGMDSCAANDIDGDEISDTLTASTLNNPGGIWTDGTRLLVADTDNNRVLVWDTFPTTNGEAADWVIGQIDMTSSATALDDVSLNAPRSVTSNKNQIIVADSGNARVLIFDSFPAANSPAASNVIGQPDFTTTGTGTSDTQMTSYDAVYVDRNRLFVVDSNRVLVFSNPVVP
jgi:hypothetical protein